MKFRYFAYGSNLWLPQMRSRCPSATPLRTGTLKGWAGVYDKPSTDGSAKLNIRPRPGHEVEGIVYEIEDSERHLLDLAEPRYTPIDVEVGDDQVVTYTYEGPPHDAAPFDWYVATATMGAASHGLSLDGLDVAADPDPLAPGLRPASRGDVPFLQEILSDGIAHGGDRYYIHPGDYAWWVFHDDPRHPDHFSTWIQADSGFVTIDSMSSSEVNVFARPGVDRMPMVRWAQRRLEGFGEVGWISDTDIEMSDVLTEEGYEAVFSYRSYQWDLTRELPDPDPPPGWSLRAVSGEDEANLRRAAAHAAFQSTMPEAMHLQRYLDFMRSPVYDRERDLVAVSPDGRIGSFMIWWGDRTGVAQIEPFGTHPDFHRQGIGRSLIHFGLEEMRRAGMSLARVCTEDDRPATAFYEGVGFEDVGRLRWWKPAASPLQAI